MLGKRLSIKLSKKHVVIKAGRGPSVDIKIDLERPNDHSTFEEKVDAIIHCASSFGNDDIDSAFRNECINSLGAFQVARLAEKTKCKHIIYISTISTYDVPQNEYFGSYGLSKRHAQENLSLICSKLGISYTSLLPSALYDDNGEARKHQSFLYHMMDMARQGKDICIYGSMDHKRNYLYIDEFVNIIEKVLCKQVNGIYPCVHPISYKMSEIAKLILYTFGQGGNVKFLPDKPNQLEIFIPDDLSIYQLTGYYPIVDLPTGIEKIKAKLYS